MEEDLTSLDKLKEMFRNLKSRMSELRKKGYDLSIPEIMILVLPPKIKLAEVTKKKEDIENAIAVISEINHELDEIEKTKNINIMLRDVNNLLNQCADSLKEGNIDEAKEIYLKAEKIYRELPEEAKIEVFDKYFEVRENIEKFKNNKGFNRNNQGNEE